jgi:hypothetical protein
MFKKLLFALLAASFGFLAFAAFINAQPSFAGCGSGCGGRSCSGNMNVAQWGPANYNERPIYPMRGCGPMGCQKGWRSAIIYPPPTRPYGGQVISSPPIGCAPVGCSAPPGCGAAIGCGAPVFQPCAVPVMLPPACSCGPAFGYGR